MTAVQRIAGTAGTFPVVPTGSPTGPPVLTIFSDAARTVVAVAAATCAASGSPGQFLGAYPATLAAGTYYLSFTTQYAGGSSVDADDTLVLVAQSVGVGGSILAAVRSRLNKTTNADDVELQDMIDAAVRAYRRLFGKITGSSTEALTADDEGRVFLRSRNATVVTAVVDSVGAAVAYDAYDETDEGILHGLTYGRTVTVTYQVGIPEDHQEVIIADVAGYFAATQRGGQRSALPAEGYAEGFGQERSTPLTLWPRIQALAPVRIG